MSQTQTVGRALDILFVLAEAGKPLTVSEIAQRVPLPESTAYRLVKTLELNGVVERKSKGQISLGMKIVELAKSLHRQLDQNLLSLSRPVMEKLTETFNETSLLVVRRGDIGVTVQYVEGNRLIGLVVKNGNIHPLHKGASGKAILAFEQSKVIEKILASLDKDMAAKVYEELREIRQDGHVVTVGEVDPDTFAAAAPIFDSEGDVIASLALVGPQIRFNEPVVLSAIEHVKESANLISRRMKQYKI